MSTNTTYKATKFTIQDQKFSLKFAKNNGDDVAGRLYEGDDGMLRFEGDAQESSKVFFDLVCARNNGEVFRLTNKVKQLESDNESLNLTIENLSLFEIFTLKIKKLLNKEEKDR